MGFTSPDTCDSSSQTGRRIMRYELADCEWGAIKPILPKRVGFGD
jgi:hypothetical protein